MLHCHGQETPCYKELVLALLPAVGAEKPTACCQIRVWVPAGPLTCCQASLWNGKLASRRRARLRQGTSQTGPSSPAPALTQNKPLGSGQTLDPSHHQLDHTLRATLHRAKPQEPQPIGTPKTCFLLSLFFPQKTVTIFQVPCPATPSIPTWSAPSSLRS